MEELDLLKKDWKKNENSFEQKSEMDIYKMIHKRSSSIVKWILIISIVEFIIWNIINFGFTGEAYIKRNFSAEVFDYILEMNTILSITCLIILTVFVYIFYKNYKNINAATSTKQLMKDILRTRKTVTYYVWTNILLFIVGNFIVIFIRLNYENKFIKLGEKLNHDTGMLLQSLGITVSIIAFVAFLIWLFYKLVYGILLKKLNHNYKELKKIDL